MQKLLKHPLLTFDRSIAVSGDGSYLLHSRILGVVPFKDIKVIPEDEKTCLCQRKYCWNLYGDRRGAGH